MKKLAVLSIDVEDWYHLEYFKSLKVNGNETMLDGLENFIDLVDSLGIKGSFFFVGELVQKCSNIIKCLHHSGHDIGIHSNKHIRPLSQTVLEFQNDLKDSLGELNAVVNVSNPGFRAPCFALDRIRLDVVKNLGFKYDASRIQFGSHPLYGDLDLDGFTKISKNIFRKGDFFEFQNSTFSIMKRELPVSGGGYLRIFPWIIMKQLIYHYLKSNEIYTLYIHPFELSKRCPPILPKEVKTFTRFRFQYGQKRTILKLKKLIKLLQDSGCEFITFKDLADRFIDKDLG